MLTVADCLRLLDEWYPPSWAEEWDSSGLQVGDPSWPVERVMVALDPTSEVIADAAGAGCGLLVTHHPLLFRSLERVDLTDPVARAVATALSGQVAVVACHTNADVASPGVSDTLAAVLDVPVSRVLQETDAGSRAKLVTFVPSQDTPKVLESLARAGAGNIGEYSHCSFRVRGTGTFLPSDRANPAMGDRGALNEVEEDRLEMVVPHERLDVVIGALMESHPYEEVAYDVVPLHGGEMLGLGRIGTVEDGITVAALSQRCRDRLGGTPRLVGDPDRVVRRVALCGGSGASLIPDAIRAGAEVFVTGDVKHHDALEASAAGLAVIDAGHHATEWPFVDALRDRLASAANLDEVLVSSVTTDPFRPS